MKLHDVVARRPGCLPLPLSLMASGAAQHDLPAAKQILEDHIILKQGCLYADKAYIDAASTVRSLSGLLLHLFGRIAAALVSLIFYP